MARSQGKQSCKRVILNGKGVTLMGERVLSLVVYQPSLNGIGGRLAPVGQV